MASAAKMGNFVGAGEYRKHKCAECGEEFVLPCSPAAYRFKRGATQRRKYFCKESCLRKYEATHRSRSNFWHDYLE